MTLNFLTALFLFIGAVLIIFRQIVLSPKNATFPCAPEGVRVAMFIVSAAMVGIAVLFYGQEEPYAGRAAAPVAVLSGVLALYNMVMFWNVAAQRYHPRVWTRLNRAHALARRTPPPARTSR